MRAAALFAFLLAAAAVAAAAQTSRAIWIDVPYVQQPRDGCGAASLSMVMQYWARQQGKPAGADASVEAIQQQLYSPKAHGITDSAMKAWLRQHGFLVFALDGRWSDLEEQLSKGRPLIVAIRPEGQSSLHYVVVDGIDPARNLVTMNDPAERKLLTQERAGFEKDWSATGHWMLLAVPASPSQ